MTGLRVFNMKTENTYHIDQEYDEDGDVIYYIVDEEGEIAGFNYDYQLAMDFMRELTGD